MEEKLAMYVEDSTFMLPYIENEVLSLGALWDCHHSKTLGFNLFAKQLNRDHWAIHPIRNSDCHLVHVKSMEDKLNMLDINNTISIEILSGILHVEGSGHYNNMQTRNFSEEQLICRYNLNNYFVELLPQAKEIMDKIVIDQLLNKQIMATHVVHGLILGAEVNADIRIEQKDTSKNTSVKGGLIGCIPLGKVNASLKTSLDVLNSKEASNYNKRITFNSKPPMKKQPTTIDQICNLIENIGKYIQKEQHFGEDITGVPIQFKLVPISQFLNIEVEKLYKQLQDSIFKNFRTMLIALKDYQSPEYVKSCVLRKEYRLQKILSDSQSKLSENIIEYQEKLKKITNDYFQRSCEALKKYKIKHCNSDALLKIMHEYENSDFNIVKVQNEIESFASYGRRELNSIHEEDATHMNVEVIYFTNSNELDGWLNSGIKVKILLRTCINTSKRRISDGIFQNLFKIFNDLQKRNIEVRIALPSISNNFSLEIKDHKEPKTYTMEEIPQVLRILSATVGMEDSIESRFYMLIASDLNIQLPLELKNFSGLNDLISLLHVDYKLYFAQSYLDFLQKIQNPTHNDIQWKFFIALNAPDTALDAVRGVKKLATKKVFSETEWIIGETSISSSHAAPLLLVFYNKEIKAICLDNLDLLILLQIFENKKYENFSVLSFTSLPHNIIIQSNADQTLSDALNIIRSAFVGKDLDVIASIAQLASMNDNELKDFLIKEGCYTTDSKFFNKILHKFYDNLQHWINSRDPFLAKINDAKIAVESVLNNLEDNEAQLYLNKTIDLLFNDQNCKHEIKAKFEKWRSVSDLRNRFNGYLKILDQLFAEYVQKESSHVLKLLSLLKSMLQLSNKEFSDVLMNEIIPFYVSRLPRNKDPYKSRWNEIEEFIKRKSLPNLVSLLAKLHCDSRLYKLHEKLIQIEDIDNQNDIKNLFKLLSEKDFTDEHSKFLWQNSRFIYLVQTAVSYMPSVVCSTLFKSIDIKELPYYVPRNIQQLLKEHNEQNNFSLNELNNVDDIMRYLEHLHRTYKLPDEILRKSIARNKQLEGCLITIGVLTDDNWDSKCKSTKRWDRDEIESALEKLKKWENNKQEDEALVIINADDIFGCEENNAWKSVMCEGSSEDLIFEYKVYKNWMPLKNEKSSNGLKFAHKIHENWKSLINEQIDMIMPKDYLRVCKIIQTPKLSETQHADCMITILPYIMQKVKMWGCDALTASNIAGLMVKTKSGLSFTANQDPFDDLFSEENSNPFSDNESENKSSFSSDKFNENKNSLTRIDCIASLLSIVDCMVAQDILCSMAKFPMVLPLVIPDFEHEKYFKVMLPLLVGTIIKWEREPGMIVENHLFESPFRFIVAIRIGSNSTGKSTILNQIMAIKHMFSSVCEPGAFRGKPHTLPGTVEFTWLTQETCSDGLWKHVDPHYKKGTNEIVLLANLHGDALEYEEQVQWLKQAKSDFLVFIMPDGDQKKKWHKLKKILDGKKLVHTFVDCPNMKINIETGCLTNDETIEKVRELFGEILNSDTGILQELSKFKSGIPLKLTEGIECNESLQIVNFIKNQSCAATKKIMKLQKRHIQKTKDNRELWEKNKLLQDLMKLFGKVMNLPIEKRRKALAHLERDLHKISAEESSKAREDIWQIKEKLRRTIDLTNKNEDMVKNYKAQINNALEQVDNVSLGLEHFFREMGQIYELTLNNPNQLFKNRTKLLLKCQISQPVDGDPGKISSAQLSKALQGQIHELIKNKETAFKSAEYRFDCCKNDIGVTKDKNKEFKFQNLYWLENCFMNVMTNAFKKNLNKILVIDSCSSESSQAGRQSSYVNEINELFNKYPNKRQIYELTLGNSNDISQFPKSCAELFIEGQVIELLDGDSGKMPGAWLSSIFKEVTNKYPDLKVFVISILGLQSSGKSTLLNALFSCRFAVSVGRCTRGLFMRLLFLENELRKELNVDAILLIDTEGLGALEKINEKDSLQKDRLMATFVMGISNLTLINVLGEYMNDLIEILQIAIVAIARLEKAEIAPDILMVQHLTERNEAKTSTGCMEFCKALQKALNCTDKNDAELGITNAKCLKILNERIERGELLNQFRSFRNGASAYAPPSEQYHEDVTKLYKDILEACKNSRSKVSFKQWHSLINCFWESVKNEHFAVQFKNLREMYEHIERGELIEKVKEAINAAFQSHTEKCSELIRRKTLHWAYDKSLSSDSLHKECTENIEEELSKTELDNCNECKKVLETKGELENYLNDKEECKSVTLRTIKDHSRRRQETMKVQLTQELNAGLIREDCTREFRDVITRRLKEELKKRQPSSQFDKNERNKIADDIWNELRRLAGDKTNVSPVRTRIKIEVKEVYSNVETVYHKFEASSKPNIQNKSSEIENLMEKLQGLPEEILKEKNAIKFEHGMISILKKKVGTIITEFSEKGLIKHIWIKQNRWGIHLHALENFYEKMQDAQHKWDDNYDLLKILDRKEDEYRVLINYRLQHGFTYASEGSIIAEYLLKAIRKKALNSGNEKRMREILKINWMNSTEHARLKYFKHLAEEVQEHEFNDALIHFENPEVKITEWFKYEVNNIYSEISHEEYTRIFEQEFKETTSKISNYKTIEEFQNFVKSYEGCEYKMPAEINETNDPDVDAVDALRDSMLETLRDQREKYEVRPSFKEPSEYELVMEKLGCTKSCTFCGAICWGSRRHEENTDDTKRHHSCHQPSGLRGTNHKDGNVLDSTPCHLRADDTLVCWGAEGNRSWIKWGDAKQKHFTGWLFLPHNKINFNNLMCWFFQELNSNIAEKYGLIKASEEDLQNNKCINLDYDQIMKDLNVEIGC
ncbi:11083_t:CDS:2 [Gigaspora margarita]|uniref:11083_t:CDS:1 n=1 Tax=Gigaspora margarita TaxID=4874 RepID=A0ABN7ULG9_GIGMA|nr:11083_t:CDS:2 [Gigaspora margarita]